MSSILKQPASICGQYLMWEANTSLSSKPADLIFLSPVKGLARAVYTLGVLVLSPIGATYHTLAGAKCFVHALLVSDSKESQQLHARKWQHLKAAALDFSGFYSVTGGLLITALLVISVADVILNPIKANILSLGHSLLITFSLYLNHGFEDNTFLNYITNPGYASRTYFDVVARGDNKFSQADAHSASAFYNGLIRQGVLLDVSASDDELKAIMTYTNSLYGKTPIQIILAVAHLVKTWDAKLSPRAKNNVQALLAKEEELLKADRDALDAAKKEKDTEKQNAAYLKTITPLIEKYSVLAA